MAALMYSPSPLARLRAQILLRHFRSVLLTTTNGLAGQATGGCSVTLHRALLLLGVSQHAEPQQVREAYIRLAKIYHPDSGSPQASNQKFIQIREAYILCMSHVTNTALSNQLYQALEQELHAMERSLGYQRRLLAHRHYLEHDAMHGTLSQRQRDHTQSRLNQAIDSVYERQFQKALQNSEVDCQEVESYSDKRLKKRALKNSSAPLQHIADEKIMEEMKMGGFTQIRGKGAPIRNEPATHVLDNLDEKLNKVLISAGCAPDWITLDKDIREEISKLKVAVREAWLKHTSSSSPSKRLTKIQWQEDKEQFRESVERINGKIRKLNFEVPSLHMQRALLNFDSFLDRVTKEADTNVHERPDRVSDTGKSQTDGAYKASNPVQLDTSTHSLQTATVVSRVSTVLKAILRHFTG